MPATFELSFASDGILRHIFREIANLVTDVSGDLFVEPDPCQLISHDATCQISRYIPTKFPKSLESFLLPF